MKNIIDDLSVGEFPLQWILWMSFGKCISLGLTNLRDSVFVHVCCVPCHRFFEFKKTILSVVTQDRRNSTDKKSVFVQCCKCLFNCAG